MTQPDCCCCCHAEWWWRRACVWCVGEVGCESRPAAAESAWRPTRSRPPPLFPPPSPPPLAHLAHTLSAVVCAWVRHRAPRSAKTARTHIARAQSTARTGVVLINCVKGMLQLDPRHSSILRRRKVGRTEAATRAENVDAPRNLRRRWSTDLRHANASKTVCIVRRRVARHLLVRGPRTTEGELLNVNVHHGALWRRERGRCTQWAGEQLYLRTV